MGSVVLVGAILREGVLLGAGSLVTEGKQLEGGHLLVRPTGEAGAGTDKGRKGLALAYSAQHYVKLKNDYLK